jgi:hypothetical protein
MPLGLHPVEDLAGLGLDRFSKTLRGGLWLGHCAGGTLSRQFGGWIWGERAEVLMGWFLGMDERK